MALSDTLKNLSDRSRGERDFEARRPEIIACWQQSLEALYGRIEGWLQPHVDEGVLRIGQGSTRLAEEMLGHYDAPTRTLAAGPAIVMLQPAARVIIGGKGRVDLYRQGRSGRDERVTLIREDDAVEARWHLRRPLAETGNPRDLQPLTQTVFETALDSLLR